ncbi:Uncharacterized protein BM_BM1046 [Brugia malayi]|uniref:Bm1046 n=1 Tax=Brugia malayi TaxID=6279 RepID=A0A0J9Y5U4_BRUMA|nr:Uncharacterized protein BM_BM1046 [Brugia malayi]CDQ02623.1 Bm1046 [Brugia malayi]VIO96628.1 Uncharacterized protein BM_BM1046 [Brugia malayi]
MKQIGHINIWNSDIFTLVVLRNQLPQHIRLGKR